VLLTTVAIHARIIHGPCCFTACMGLSASGQAMEVSGVAACTEGLALSVAQACACASIAEGVALGTHLICTDASSLR
jgi:hypothetical protein